MKTKFAAVALLALMLGLAKMPAWAQTTSIEGKVIGVDGQPLPGALVVYKDMGNGKAYKMKTDKHGQFYAIGVILSVYNVTVTPPDGQETEIAAVKVTGDPEQDKPLTINLADPSKSTGGNIVSESAKNQPAQPSVSKEELAKIQAENAKITDMNAMIQKAQLALNAKQWDQAAVLLKNLTERDPNKWQFFQFLGESQGNLGQYEDAVQNYEKGIDVAQKIAAGNVPEGVKGADADPVKAKAGAAAMMNSEANAYLQLKKPDQAIKLFSKAAEIAPDPGMAYYNLCVTLYNTGNMDGAVEPCDKAIAANPNKADAYFIKGSALFGKGKMVGGKYIPPEGTVDALKKYAELQPNGTHMPEVTDMLNAAGAKIDTSYKSGKKK